MNKKIVSLVLAMCLSVGLGVSNLVFADPYEKTGGATSADWGNAGVASSSGSVTVTIPDEQKAAVGNTESKICTVFNYKSGILLSTMDQDRNVTIFDAGKARATLGYNDDGSFTVTNFYLTGSDWDKISKMSGKTDGEKLKNFLLSVGIQESALKASSVDKDGNVNTDKQVDVAWFDVAADQLKKGINYSVAINLTANYGASMTWSVNGKQQETIGYDGTVLETYNYNAMGTLESVSQTTYKLKDGQVVDDKNKVQHEKTTTTLYMDEFGRQSYATDTEGNVVTRYSYSSNGSLASVYNKENESTTYYSAGKVSFVVNDKGFTTARYAYHANGSLDGLTSYNYDEDTGATKKTTITAYKWGREVGTADLSSGTGVKNFDELRTAVAEIKADPEKAKQSLIAGAQGQDEAKNTSKYSNITNIAVYESDIKGAKGDALLRFLGISDQKAKMLAMSNGYSLVANAEFKIDTIAFETETKDGGTKTEGGKFEAYTESKTTREGKVGEKLSCKVTIMDRGGASYQVNGAEHTLRAAVNAQVTTTKVQDPAVEGEMWAPQSEEELIAKAQELGIDVNDEKAMNDLRNGFYTDANGQTFAIVNASSVNIMDGNGFQPAEGETVMVAVDNATKEQIVNNIKASGDRGIMFMGDARESTTGYLTITMNVTYGGGFVQGQEAVQQAKAEISSISAQVASAKYQYESGNMSEAEYNKIVKDAGWVGTNTDANLTTFANGGFSWDTEKSASENLRDAWRLLLNF